MNLISHEISHEKAFVLAGFRVVAFSKYHTKSGGPPGDRKPAIIISYPITYWCWSKSYRPTICSAPRPSVTIHWPSWIPGSGQRRNASPAEST